LEQGSHFGLSCSSLNHRFVLLSLAQPPVGQALFSKAVRERWCRAAAEFEDARMGLLTAGVVGIVLALAGAFTLTVRLAKPTIQQDVAYFILAYILPVALLIGFLSVLVVLLVQRKRGE